MNFHPTAFAMLTGPAFPVAEKNAIEHVRHILGRVDTTISDFRAALQLFTFCETSRRDTPETPRAIAHAFVMQAGRHLLTDWQLIACRDGVMSIYHLSHLLSGLSAAISESASLNEHVNHQLREEAAQAFRNHFPSFLNLRRAVAHSAEFMKTPRERQRHSLKPGTAMPAVFGGILDGTFEVGSLLEDNKFSMGFEGALVTLSMSDESLRFLIEVRHKTFRSFEPVLTKYPSGFGLTPGSIEYTQSY